MHILRLARSLLLFYILATSNGLPGNPLGNLLAKLLPPKKVKPPAYDLHSPAPPEYFERPDPKVVYRVDSRTPQQIQSYQVNGVSRPGFFPPRGPDSAQGYGLFSHVEGNIGSTAFVSTTDQLQTVSTYTRMRGGDPYIYKIQTSPTFADVNKSLRILRYASNAEHAALGGIPWSQVVGFTQWTKDFADFIDDKEYEKIKFTPNEQFVPVPEHLQGSRARPELAGFPEDHQAWKYEPWASLKAQKKGAQADLKSTFLEILDADETAKGRGITVDLICGNGSVGKRGLSCMERAPSNVRPATRKPKPPFQSSEEVTDQAFKRLADRYGVDTLKSKSGLTTSQLRGKLKDFKPLSSLSLSRAKSISLKGMGGALSIASLGLYAKEVVDVFTTDTSSLDRIAVVTSIVPLVGCATEAAANQEANRTDTLDTSLCFVGDVLMLTPAWPGGLAAHAARFVVGFVQAAIEFENQLNEETLRQLRVDGWDHYCSEVEKWLRSDAFKTTLEVQLQSEAAAILFAASQARGLLDDQLAPLRENATSRAELMAIYDNETRALDELTHVMCLRMKNMKRKLKDDAIHQLANWLSSRAASYDHDLTTKLGWLCQKERSFT